MFPTGFNTVHGIDPRTLLAPLSTVTGHSLPIADPRSIAACFGIDARSCDVRALTAAGLCASTVNYLCCVAPQLVQGFVANCVAQTCGTGSCATDGLSTVAPVGINQVPWSNPIANSYAFPSQPLMAIPTAPALNAVRHVHPTAALSIVPLAAANSAGW